MRFIILLSVILVSHSLYAQSNDHSRLFTEKHFVSLNILGSSSLAGITYGRKLSQRTVAEIGFGFVGIGAALYVYPFRMQKSVYCPYTGIKFSSLGLVDVASAAVCYVPLGITVFRNNRTNFSFDMGPAKGNLKTIHENEPGEHVSKSHAIKLMGNLKVGIRF